MYLHVNLNEHVLSKFLKNKLELNFKINNVEKDSTMKASLYSALQFQRDPTCHQRGLPI